MLDRISHINPQEKYKSGLKITTNPYVVNRHDPEKHHSKDSALFSPLAKLLSKINWKILNIEFPSNDEMLFNFLVNDLEFITVINFNEMYSNPYQEFSIFQINNNLGKKLQYETKLKVAKHELSILEKADPIETRNLSFLFDKISNLNIHINHTITNARVLNGLAEEISYNLNQELNYILKVIYTFISTRNKSRVKSDFILKTTQNIPIIMQKVAIIYAE